MLYFPKNRVIHNNLTQKYYVPGTVARFFKYKFIFFNPILKSWKFAIFYGGLFI